MTVREYLIAHAPPPSKAWYQSWMDVERHPLFAAEWALEWADSVIRELDQPEKGQPGWTPEENT
jgi:hypothetical protein